MGCCGSAPELPSTPIIRYRKQLGSVGITIVLGDITNEPVEVIVNSANINLVHSGGVAGAILRKAGQEVQDESNALVAELGSLDYGSVAVTSAGALPYKHIFHVVGPIYEDGKQGERELLEKSISSCLQKAESLHIRSISFPAISAGICGFPRSKCAEAFLTAISHHFTNRQLSSLREVRITNCDPATVRTKQTDVFQERFREELEGSD